MKKKVCVFLYSFLLTLVLFMCYGSYTSWLAELSALELFAIAVACLHRHFQEAWDLTSATPPRLR